jgi:hypothetical protein
MGDWTSGAAIIHACPPYHVRSVLDAFEDYGLTEEDAASGTTVSVGQCYSAAGFRCGSATDLAHDLIRCAPEVAFTVYEEPAYEWVGTTCTYVPELGLFTAHCDNSGHPMSAQSEILRLEGEPIDVRQKQLGVPWLTAIAALPQQVVVEPDRFATHWHRLHDEIVVIAGKHRGADLIFPAPTTADEIDVALAERGYRRAEAWAYLDETAELWHTDVYRTPAT